MSRAQKIGHAIGRFARRTYNALRQGSQAASEAWNQTRPTTVPAYDSQPKSVHNNQAFADRQRAALVDMVNQQHDAQQHAQEAAATATTVPADKEAQRGRKAYRVEDYENDDNWKGGWVGDVGAPPQWMPPKQEAADLPSQVDAAREEWDGNGLLPVHEFKEGEKYQVGNMIWTVPGSEQKTEGKVDTTRTEAPAEDTGAQSPTPESKPKHEHQHTREEDSADFHFDPNHTYTYEEAKELLSRDKNSYRKINSELNKWNHAENKRFIELGDEHMPLIQALIERRIEDLVKSNTERGTKIPPFSTEAVASDGLSDFLNKKALEQNLYGMKDANDYIKSNPDKLSNIEEDEPYFLPSNRFKYATLPELAGLVGVDFYEVPGAEDAFGTSTHKARMNNEDMFTAIDNDVYGPNSYSSR